MAEVDLKDGDKVWIHNEGHEDYRRLGMVGASFPEQDLVEVGLYGPEFGLDKTVYLSPYDLTKFEFVANGGAGR
jgi:hypothetical protein